MTSGGSHDESLRSLFEGVQAGDRSSWEKIVDRLNGLVWSVVRGFRLDYADAEEVGQTTWLRLLENLDRIHDPDRLGLWLATTARRESIRMLKRHARTQVVEPMHWELEQAPVDNGHDRVLDRDELQGLPRALAALSEPCQDLLRLVLCDPPLTYGEISEVLSLPTGTIGPRRNRCLSRLRALL
jgi:RNA polymerase sigma factor (sigma-70 family)